MKNYQVKIKGDSQTQTIKAGSELEAKVKFCDKRGFDYRVFASSIEAGLKTKKTLKK